MSSQQLVLSVFEDSHERAAEHRAVAIDPARLGESGYARAIRETLRATPCTHLWLERVDKVMEHPPALPDHYVRLPQYEAGRRAAIERLNLASL